MTQAFAYKQAFIAGINAVRVCLPAKATVPRAVNLFTVFLKFRNMFRYGTNDDVR